MNKKLEIVSEHDFEQILKEALETGKVEILKIGDESWQYFNLAENGFIKKNEDGSFDLTWIGIGDDPL